MAGGPITVTDRISVRVSAKTQEQSAANKKAVGGAIGKTLGHEDISDELKTQLGNTKNPVVYDEDGNAWISMEDIIAAGKVMNDAGAFATEEVHDGITYNGVYYNLIGSPTRVDHGSFTIQYLSDNGHLNWSQPYHLEGPFTEAWIMNMINSYNVMGLEVAILGVNSSSMYSVRLINDDSGNQSNARFIHYTSASASANGDSVFVTGGTTDGNYSPNTEYVTLPNNQAIDSQERLLNNFVGWRYGNVTPAGNSSEIDWTKTDAEIARDIQELHDTWDVTEHEGAVTANGTYILAGPIEFNPGD